MEMFKIMKGRDKISTDELFNRVDSDRTRGHSLRVKKGRVMMVVRQGIFTLRVKVPCLTPVLALLFFTLRPWPLVLSLSTLLNIINLHLFYRYLS